ncbi:MAG: sigma-70 family RNA polymerase sigma factor [Pseudomonadota bacterium]
MSGSADTTEEDHELIKRVADGDRFALERLYAKHHVRVFRFIRRFESNEATAEDLANDVFLDVWNQAAKFEGRSQVTSWFLSIARFKALSERRKRRNVVDPDDALSKMADPADDPEIVAQKSNKSEMLKMCIGALSEDHRVIVDLVYYHERSISEIAEILEIPQNTVKTRMFHARKNLSEIMKQNGVDRGWP